MTVVPEVMQALATIDEAASLTWATANSTAVKPAERFFEIEPDDAVPSTRYVASPAPAAYVRWTQLPR